MLRKPFHGRRIKQQVQKLTAIRTPSPRLNPVRESPGSPTRPTALTCLSPSPLPRPFFCSQNLPPTSHFPFTYQITKSPLSTNSLATGPFAGAYCPLAPDPEPNTHIEDPYPNVESLRESSDDRRENAGGRSRTQPEERALLFTCLPEVGDCCVYLVWTKRNSQELCGEEEIRTLRMRRLSKNVTKCHDCPPAPRMLEFLKQNEEVVSKLEVYPGDMYDVALEEMMKYGGEVMPLSEQVANKLEVYLGRGFRLAYEEAVGVMTRHFLPLRVALCDQMPLHDKRRLIESNLLWFGMCDFPWKKGGVPSRCSLLWCLALLQLLDWIQSGVGRKK